ncbi:CRISPR-associated endonuclease Cas1 [Nitrosopumilus sp.]|uniref:CRISPR-associated endonuclease Cas1 n=1 Tax=Nitrosopumilus sp. TaxID=2024843 RepID=UPI003B5AE607
MVKHVEWTITKVETSINVDKRKLIITNKLKNTRLEFFPHKINHDGIIIDGHTGNITFEAMRWLSKHNINLTLLNWNGQLLANLLPEQPKSGKLRIKQYQKYLDSEARFEIALKIVQAKIEHSLNLLEELSRFYESVDITKIRKSAEKEDLFLLDIMKNNGKQDISKSIKQLMTYEGRIAGIYENLIRIFNQLNPEFNFTGRKNKSNSGNYNASDEVNALLNYGYAILESEIRKVVNAVGLDYSIGFLHEINQSRTSLVYDIQELFRWIIDVSVIQLLEEKKVKKSDFVITENYHIRLGEDVAKILINKINSNFNFKYNYKNGKNYSYQIILQDNLQQLSNFIVDKKKEFDFVIPKLKLNRNDNLELRERILNMTPDERKRLRINKSTLWYMQKSLSEGKTPKIYEKILLKIQQA